MSEIYDEIQTQFLNILFTFKFCLRPFLLCFITNKMWLQALDTDQ